MRKKIASVVLVLALSLPISASAQADVQSQIVSLLQQIITLQTTLIKSLEKQISELSVQISALQKPQPATTRHVCTIVNPPQCVTELKVSRDSYNCVTGYACSAVTAVAEPAPSTTSTIVQGGSCVVHNQYCGDTIIPNGEIAHYSCCAVGSFQLCQNGVLVPTGYSSSIKKHVTNGCGLDSSYFTRSDARVKENITPIEKALDKILALNGIFFNWKESKMPPERQMGVIAQEVQKVFPEAVLEDASGILYVNYYALIAPIIEAMKELKVENDALHAGFAQ